MKQLRLLQRRYGGLRECGILKFVKRVYGLVGCGYCEAANAASMDVSGAWWMEDGEKFLGFWEVVLCNKGALLKHYIYEVSAPPGKTRGL